MKRLIVEEWISLDGFVADKDGSFDFFTNVTAEENKYLDADQWKSMESIDTMNRPAG